MLFGCWKIGRLICTIDILCLINMLGNIDTHMQNVRCDIVCLHPLLLSACPSNGHWVLVHLTVNQMKNSYSCIRCVRFKTMDKWNMVTEISLKEHNAFDFGHFDSHTNKFSFIAKKISCCGCDCFQSDIRFFLNIDDSVINIRHCLLLFDEITPNSVGINTQNDFRKLVMVSLIFNDHSSCSSIHSLWIDIQRSIIQYTN